MSYIKKNLTSLIRRLAKRLDQSAYALERKYFFADTQSKFVDLAPTDKADKDGIYTEALLFAMNNKDVTNIALTGPYGSGKSSIIRSFLKKYPRPALNISLAAFVPEDDPKTDSKSEVGSKKVSRQEVERSILQQMLYGADANKLPLSRFKRIQTPGIGLIFKSLYIMLGILSIWYLFPQREDIVSGEFFDPFALSNGFNFGTFGFAVIFFWTILHQLYVASFGLSLKSISLKDVEIKPANDDQASILNRHLDEIIYFFQSTKYDLVIIEDIDRFENTDIFVTLREINSLVNKNAGVKRTIRFLYALRDDMFVNTERTKFFEFIVPVIPIINTSNSIDKVLEQGKRLDLEKHLGRQFLREVSRYLNDLRLIQNIFNEYAIYVASLETDGESILDANKLLAVLIYKNVYPRDFEDLHRDTGDLAEILSLKNELVRKGEESYRIEIANLEEKLRVAEQQVPTDLRELRQIYAMALIEKLSANVTSISFDEKVWVSPQQMASHDAFEKILDASRLFVRQPNHYNRQQQSQINISDLQSEMSLQKSYQERKQEIESKSIDNKNKCLRRIRDLQSKIATLRTAKLNELLRIHADSAQALFEGFGKDGELARYLILEGYLDDTYYQYTSLFHEGRLSPNDNKFLIQIRAFVTPEPNHPIDNPKEVIAAMRDEDFRQSYVLNVKLVEALLSDRILYGEQTKKLFQVISSDFEDCESFLDAYYASGRNVAELLSGLASTWKGLVSAILASSNSISHVTQLVANLPESSLSELAGDFDELPTFVAEHLPEILELVPELAPERLKCLDFEIKDLASIKEHFGVVQSMFEAGLFELTIANLEYIYEAVLGKKDISSLREKNFTTIRSANNAALMERIERDFDNYFIEVLLAQEENTKEDAPAILSVIQHDTLDEDDLGEFLARQETLLPTMEGVSVRLHAMLFQLGKIEPTWLNCHEFIDGEGFEADSLLDYLGRDDVRAALLAQPIPDDSDFFPLRQFLINAGSLSDAAYREYVQALPNQFKQAPEDLESAKIKILIDERKIVFSKTSLDALADHRNLQVLFVAANINIYLKEPDGFALDDDFHEELLQSGIDNAAKLKLIDLMDLEALVDLPERAALVGAIINRSDTKVPGLNGPIVQALVIHSAPLETKVSLLNEYHEILTNDEVRQVLADLPRPYSEIKTGSKQPKLRNTPTNQRLVRWLKSRSIISSWREGKFMNDDIKVHLFKSTR